MVKVCYPICTHLKNITCEQMGIFRTLMAAFFFCFFFVRLWLGWYQHKEKTQKVRCFTGSGLFLIQMGLFTLYSATASVEQIKNVDIWGQFKMVFFFQIKESLSPVCVHIRTPNQQLHTDQCPIQKLNFLYSTVRKMKRKMILLWRFLDWFLWS